MKELIEKIETGLTADVVIDLLQKAYNLGVENRGYAKHQYEVMDGKIDADKWALDMFDPLDYDMSSVFSKYSKTSAEIATSHFADKWAKVSDRLPEEDGEYWCFDKQLKKCGSYIFIAGRFPTYITHWQPLPTPPQE